MNNSNLQIGERLKDIRIFFNKSQVEFSNDLEIAQSILSAMEKGKRNVSFNTIIALCTKYNQVNLDWLLTGRSEMIISQPTPINLHLNSNLLHLNTVQYPNKATNNILVPVAAFGGYLGEWTQEYISQDLVYVDIPGSPRDARTFEISGTSMEPVIMHGDYVVTQRIEKIEHIRKGHMYVIISLLQGITVKYVYDSGDSLILEPANRLEHVPLVISKADIREIWQVVLRLTKHIIDT